MFIVFPRTVFSGREEMTEHSIEDYLYLQYLDCSLKILSSYATKDPFSSIHQSYGTSDDLSDMSMFYLYSKLDYHNSTLRNSGVLHVDVFPRRIDQKKIVGGDAARKSPQAMLPKVLTEYWVQFACDCLNKSRAKIILVTDNSALKVYLRDLKRRSIEHTSVWACGQMRDLVEMLIAIKEHAPGSSAISRLIIATFHPEAFGRLRARVPVNMQRRLAARERLINFVTAVVHDDTHLLSYLSSTPYYS
jgi:hypothetical protein